MKRVEYKTLKMSNFLSFGKEQTFDFKNGISAIFGVNRDKDDDANGSGKSSVLEGVSFAIFGNTLKDIKKDEIVNRQAEKNCEVELEFDVVDDGGKVDKYIVKRGIKPSFCKLYKNGSDISLSGISETTKYIEDTIRTNEVMFRNTCMMGLENTVPFAKQRANEKRDFIEGVFDLGFIKEMSKYAKKELDAYVSESNVKAELKIMAEKHLSSYEESRDGFESSQKEKIGSVETKIEMLRGQIRDLKAESSDFDVNEYEILKKKIDKVKENKKESENTVLTVRSKLAELESESKLLEERIKNGEAVVSYNQKIEEAIHKFCADNSIDDSTFQYDDEKKKIKDIIVKLTADSSELKERRGRESYSLSSAEKKIEELETLGAVCDKCGRPFGDDDIEARNKIVSEANASIASSKNNISEIDDKVNLNAAKIKELETRLSNIEKINVAKNKIRPVDTNLKFEKQKLAGVKDEINAWKKKLDDAMSSDTKISEIYEKLTALHEEMTAKKIQKDSIEAKISVLSAGINSAMDDKIKLESECNPFISKCEEANEEIVDLSKKLDDLEHKCMLFRKIRSILSDDGYRAYMITKYINLLNTSINRYLRKMDAPVDMFFNEYFEDRLVDQLTGEECSYASLSGGEKKRIDLACMLAFSDVRKMQGDVVFSTLFYDEIFDSALSASACEKLMEILKDKYESLGESSVVISHKDELKNDPSITRTITVEKIGGVSTIHE